MRRGSHTDAFAVRADVFEIPLLPMRMEWLHTYIGSHLQLFVISKFFPPEARILATLARFLAAAPDPAKW